MLISKTLCVSPFINIYHKTSLFKCDQIFKNLQVEAPEIQANPQKMEIPVQETDSMYKRTTRNQTQ